MKELTLHIESLASNGAGVGHNEAGKTVFVAHSAPGDVVTAHIVQDKKRYLRADLINLKESSPLRVDPPCPFAGECGGCSWQHLSYETQLRAKRAFVVDALVHLAKIDPLSAETLTSECVASSLEYGYRNKLELATSHEDTHRLTLGFHMAASKKVLSPKTCLLAQAPIQRAPAALQGALRYLENAQDLKIFRVGVRSSLRTHSCEIALWTTPGPFPRAAAAKTLSSALEASSIVRVIAEPGSARKIKGVEVLHGAGYWEEKLNNFSYKVSAPSFFQVNSGVAKEMQHLVLECLQPTTRDVVADLYSGVGTFTLPLAHQAKEVIAVESSGPAVRDLRRNAEGRFSNIEVIGGDSARELSKLTKLDGLVVDPPRSGLGKGMVQTIADTQASRLVYISCNPATWARDVARFAESSYRLTKATPLDLFPQTHHVEVVSQFVRS